VSDEDDYYARENRRNSADLDELIGICRRAWHRVVGWLRRIWL
jgi:hypothetical protein